MATRRKSCATTLIMTLGLGIGPACVFNPEMAADGGFDTFGPPPSTDGESGDSEGNDTGQPSGTASGAAGASSAGASVASSA